MFLLKDLTLSVAQAVGSFQRAFSRFREKQRTCLKFVISLLSENGGNNEQCSLFRGWLFGPTIVYVAFPVENLQRNLDGVLFDVIEEASSVLSTPVIIRQKGESTHLDYQYKTYETYTSLSRVTQNLTENTNSSA